MILSQDQTLVDFLVHWIVNILTYANKRELVGLCVELTHGLAYLVFKYQLLLKHRLPLVSETTDYTEAISVVKPSK